MHGASKCSDGGTDGTSQDRSFKIFENAEHKGPCQESGTGEEFDTRKFCSGEVEADEVAGKVESF
jgi:hypothetical protein